MPLFEAVRLALAQIRAQKLKSSFSLLGVMVGVMFLIAVVSIVDGMGRYMRDDVVGKVIPVNSFELRQRPNIQLGDVSEETRREWRRRPRIRREDIGPVTEALPPGTLWAVVSEDNLWVESRYARRRNVSATAASEDYFTIKRMGVVSGRLPTPQEFALGAPVVVIGQDVRDHFFPALDPIGREIRIAGIPYRVVGVAEKQGSALGISFDKFVVAPLASPLQRATNGHGVVDGILIQSPSPTAMTTNMETVRQVMRTRHRLRPAEPDDFTLQTSDSALEFWLRIQGVLVWAGVALPAIGLVVGAIVIMNIMLVAVAERTREIGLRKSLGARRRDIMAQFLAESAALSTVGAAAGVGLGIGLSQLVAAASPLPAAVEPWSIGVGVLVGTVIGITAGIYPASRASRLDPIAALRQE